MPVLLNSDTQRLIEEEMKRGGYASADDAVQAALESLRQLNSKDQFDQGELDALLAEGERSGEPLDGEQVLAELRLLRQQSQADSTTKL